MSKKLQYKMMMIDLAKLELKIELGVNYPKQELTPEIEKLILEKVSYYEQNTDEFIVRWNSTPLAYRQGRIQKRKVNDKEDLTLRRMGYILLRMCVERYGNHPALYSVDGATTLVSVVTSVEEPKRTQVYQMLDRLFKRNMIDKQKLNGKVLYSVSDLYYLRWKDNFDEIMEKWIREHKISHPWDMPQEIADFVDANDIVATNAVAANWETLNAFY